jgi:membrane fusion protein, heavy metal efflux system
MRTLRSILVCALTAMSLQAVPVLAHEGHDDAAPPIVSLPGANVPRVEAQSELFEIVGTVQDGTLILFLDRYATNEPVVDAKIDIEAGQLKGAAQANPDGSYAFKDATLSQPGKLPFTFTIVAGRDSDLLTGELAITDPDVAKAHLGDGPLRQRRWWITAALILLAGIGIAFWLRAKRVKGTAR